MKLKIHSNLKFVGFFFFFRYRSYTNVYIAVPLVYIAVLLYPFYFRLCLFKHVPGYLPVYYAQIGTLLLLLTKIMITRYSVNGVSMSYKEK